MFGYTVRCDDLVLLNITLDTQAVGQGIFEMMVPDDKTLLAFGMINKQILDILEKHLRGTFDEMFMQKVGLTPEGYDEFVSCLGLGECIQCQDSRKDYVTTMSTEVSKDLYGAAARVGKMIV